ncbi:MAG: methyl-accepting chemotaxis protein [Acetatifactor sp.]
MENKSMLQKNEEQANRVAARVMIITEVILTLIFILNVIGVFVVRQSVMTVAYVVGSICLLLPTVLIRVLGARAEFIKYLMVICAAVFLLLLTTTLTYHTVVVYVLPIAIASLYFSKKLNVFATILTSICVSVGQYLSFVLKTTTDHNFDTVTKLVIYGILPRLLCLIAVAAIFTTLCSRTASMLGSLMGAEEQEKMLADMVRYKENNQKLSVEMKQMIETLVGHTKNSNELNQKLAAETTEIVRGTKDNSGQIETINESLGTITVQMTELERMSDTLASSAEEIRVLSNENQVTMDRTTDSMNKISNSAEQCMESIGRLETESKAIEGIIQTITEIASQTELLALNASIEAARAGENGRGFSVVAQEIQKLSEQTQKSVKEIESIIRQVVSDTQTAVETMKVSSRDTQQGLGNINRAAESTGVITASNQKMSQEIKRIAQISKEILKHEQMVAQAMESVRENTSQNLVSVEHVMEVTGENSRGTEKLVDMVEDIRRVSDMLNEE